jgi:hypothetical protein
MAQRVGCVCAEGGNQIASLRRQHSSHVEGVLVDFDNTDNMTEKQMQSNQVNWDARTPVHVASRFYGLDGSRTPDSWFGPFEWDDLGDLNDRDLVHLQCHLGTETVASAEVRGRLGSIFPARPSCKHC